jgi:hypothetical protein
MLPLAISLKNMLAGELSPGHAVCHLDARANHARDELSMPEGDVSALTDYLELQLSQTPLELMAQACLERPVMPATSVL